LQQYGQETVLIRARADETVLGELDSHD
jgi:hypothetical protein